MLLSLLKKKKKLDSNTTMKGKKGYKLVVKSISFVNILIAFLKVF